VGGGDGQAQRRFGFGIGPEGEKTHAPGKGEQPNTRGIGGGVKTPRLFNRLRANVPSWTWALLPGRPTGGCVHRVCDGGGIRPKTRSGHGGGPDFTKTRWGTGGARPRGKVVSCRGAGPGVGRVWQDSTESGGGTGRGETGGDRAPGVWGRVVIGFWAQPAGPTGAGLKPFVGTLFRRGCPRTGPRGPQPTPRVKGEFSRFHWPGGGKKPGVNQPPGEISRHLGGLGGKPGLGARGGNTPKGGPPQGSGAWGGTKYPGVGAEKNGQGTPPGTTNRTFSFKRGGHNFQNGEVK